VGGKAGVLSIAIALVAGMGAGGQRKLMMRVLTGVNSVMLAARVRDYINHAVRGATSGGIVTERWADGGWARQQQISIPQAVTAALRIACVDEYGELDEEKFESGMKELKEMYRDFFVESRSASMVLYTGASYFGLSAMREYFSPSVPATFASGIGESFRITVFYLLGTSFVEGEEEPGWFAMAKAVGAWKGLPFAVARAPDDIGGKIKGNLGQLSITAMMSFVPFQPGWRAADRFYGKSSVNAERAVTVSHADSLEMHAGIRAGQNMATVILFTAAGVATQPQVKQALFALAAVLNGATHWRGNVVAQILQSGREAHLLFTFDMEKRFNLHSIMIRKDLTGQLPDDVYSLKAEDLINLSDEDVNEFGGNAAPDDTSSSSNSAGQIIEVFDDPPGKIEAQEAPSVADADPPGLLPLPNLDDSSLDH
jgi:hypothetical protein